MAKKTEDSAESILRSIREKDSINFDAYVNLLIFFQTNSKLLADFNILDGISSLSVGEDGVSEKELAQAEKRVTLMTKFSEKYDYYLKTLNSLRDAISKEDVKRAEQEAEIASKSGLSVEAFLKNKSGK